VDDFKPITLRKREGKKPLVVSLRPLSLQSILVYPQGYKVIGTVRRGMNLGLLAIAPDGVFVRVNGWYVEHLVQRAVCAAICKCQDPHPIKAWLIAASRRNRMPLAMPLVSIRKRRTIERPETMDRLQRDGIHLPVVSAFFQRNRSAQKPD
jgi:hypothetical protein